MSMRQLRMAANRLVLSGMRGAPDGSSPPWSQADDEIADPATFDKGFPPCCQDPEMNTAVTSGGNIKVACRNCGRGLLLSPTSVALWAMASTTPGLTADGRAVPTDEDPWEPKPHWKKGDRVTRPKVMDDGTWKKEGDACLKKSPLLFGVVVDIMICGSEYKYKVRWDESKEEKWYLAHGLDKETEEAVKRKIFSALGVPKEYLGT